MTLNRTGWLAALLLVLLGAGVLLVRRWPESTPALDCPPDRVTWADAGTGLIARCAAEGEPLLPGPAGQALTVGQKLDLNRATEQDLAQIPGIGPSLARSIVEERTRLGRFETWDQVDEVRGVGPSKLSALKEAAELRR